jgi:hypothetical protein
MPFFFRSAYTGGAIFACLRGDGAKFLLTVVIGGLQPYYSAGCWVLMLEKNSGLSPKVRHERCSSPVRELRFSFTARSRNMRLNGFNHTLGIAAGKRVAYTSKCKSIFIRIIPKSAGGKSASNYNS